MGINFEELKNKAQGFVEQHGEKIEQGVERAGEVAKQRFGHAEQVDKAVGKVQELIPDRPGRDERKPGDA